MSCSLTPRVPRRRPPPQTHPQASHVGKVVVSSPRPHLASPPSRDAAAGGGVVITGGLGALGLLTARWLAGQGARRLILVSGWWGRW